MIYNTNDRLTAFEPAADTVKRIQTVKPQETNNKPKENKQAKEIDSAFISDSALKSLEAKNVKKENLNNETKMSINQATKIKYLIDEKSKVTLQLIDSGSDKVIQEIPPESQSRISKGIEKFLSENNKKSNKTSDSSIDAVI